MCLFSTASLRVLSGLPSVFVISARVEPMRFKPNTRNLSTSGMESTLMPGAIIAESFCAGSRLAPVSESTAIGALAGVYAESAGIVSARGRSWQAIITRHKASAEMLNAFKAGISSFLKMLTGTVQVVRRCICV
jgi:hypothetical protein